MSQGERIQSSLLFRVDGHASDLALSVMVDGESSLLDGALLLHVDDCELCVARMVEFAELGFPLEAELALLGRERARVLAFPKTAFAAALFILLFSLGRRLAGASGGDLTHDGLAILRMLRASIPLVLTRYGGALLVLAALGTVMAVFAGVAVARRAIADEKGAL